MKRLHATFSTFAACLKLWPPRCPSHTDILSAILDFTHALTSLYCSLNNHCGFCLFLILKRHYF